MKVSIAIPTHNRASELKETLRTLSQIETRSVDDYEVLVIGNGCTDQTAEVARDFAPGFGGRLRYVGEDTLGLNHARNRAVSESQFELVALLDDDVEVDRNWLSAVVTAFRSEDCAVVGGKAFLIYPCNRPRWLGEKIEGLLSKVDGGPHRRPAAADELFGLNLIIRKEWIARVGPFRPDLDRVGGCLISGGDTELLERIAAAGGRLIYEPRAVVGHRVPVSRLRRTWFWSRIFWGKWGDARTPSNPTAAFTLLRWSVRLLMRTTWLMLRKSINHGFRSPEFFHETVRLVAHFGTLVGSLSRLLGQAHKKEAEHSAGSMEKSASLPIGPIPHAVSANSP